MQLLKSLKNGQTSVILRVKLYDSSVTTQAGKTGLTSASSGLIISTIADNEAAATAYTQAGSTIETIASLGTYAAPTATKVRFKELDATNHPGVYEIQIADARFAVSSAKTLLLSISGVTNLAQADFEIPLLAEDPYSADKAWGAVTVSKGIAVTNSVSNGAGVVITGNGTGHGLSVISGNGATGNGFNAAANSTNGHGVNILGTGTGNGVLATSGSGATGDGAKFVAASTNGHGFEVTGAGTGNGILATSGSGATGDGAKFVSAATNGNGLELAGVGTGAGLISTGGATGPGGKLVGGSSSGDALLTATTSGHAFNLACTGSAKHPIAGVVESGYDPTQCLQLIVSAIAGKVSISGDTVTFRDVNDSANRIVATTDGDGQRTAVTLTVA